MSCVSAESRTDVILDAGIEAKIVVPDGAREVHRFSPPAFPILKWLVKT